MTRFFLLFFIVSMCSCSSNTTSFLPQAGNFALFNFGTSQYYAYDASHITLQNGSAQLLAPSQTDKDSSALGFGGGAYNGTQFSNGLTLSSSAPAPGSLTASGNFRSRIFSVATATPWTSLQWIPAAPYGKPLPNAGTSETGYSAGNAVMGGNVLLLHLDDAAGSSTIADSSAFANQGTCGASCPTLGTAGRFNESANFDGSADSIVIPSSSSLNVSDTMTLAVWVNAPGAAEEPLVEFASTTQAGVGIYLTASGLVRANFSDASGGAHAVTTSSPLASGSWNHLVMTYAAGVGSLYVNGVLAGTVSLGATGLQTSYPLHVGHTVTALAHPYFEGNLDELTLFHRGLTVSEVQDHYRRGALRARFQVRTCADSTCAAPQDLFSGPAGDATQWFSEASNQSLTLPQPSPLVVAEQSYFQYQVVLESDLVGSAPTLQQISVGPQHYDASNPTLQNSQAMAFSTMVSLVETLGQDNEGQTTYQISNDGSTFYYHDGSHWTPASGLAQSNASGILNGQLPNFPYDVKAPGSTYYFRVYLHSQQGLQLLDLRSIAISGR